MEKSETAENRSIQSGGDSEGSDDASVQQRSRSLLSSIGRVVFWPAIQFQKLPLLWKLSILVSMPTIGMLVLACLRLPDQMVDVSSSDELLTFVEFSVVVNDLLDQTQRERAASSVFLSDPSALNRASLLNQRVNRTDPQRLRFLNYLKGFSLERIRSTTSFSQATQYVSGLPQFRILVDRRNVTVDDSVDYYTQMNQYLLDSVLAGASYSEHARLMQLVYMFYVGSFYKECTGLERMYGSVAINNAIGFPPARLQRYSSVVDRNRYFDDTFQVLYDEVSVLYPSITFNKTLALSWYRDELYANISAYREILTANNRTAMQSLNWNVYFATITNKMNLIYADVLAVAQYIQVESAATSANAKSSLSAIVVGIAVMITVVLALSSLLVQSVFVERNILALQVKDRQASEGYLRRHFPQEFINVLNSGQGGDGMVISTSCRQSFMYVTVFTMENLRDGMLRAGDEKLLDWYGEHIRTLDSTVRSCNGFIHQVLSTGVAMALFSSAADAIRGAVMAQRHVEQDSVAMVGLHRLPPFSMFTGVHGGMMHLGVVSTDSRDYETSISPVVYDTYLLARYGQLTNARIVISQTIFEALGTVNSELWGWQNFPSVPVSLEPIDGEDNHDLANANANATSTDDDPYRDHQSVHSPTLGSPIELQSIRAKFPGLKNEPDVDGDSGEGESVAQPPSVPVRCLGTLRIGGSGSSGSSGSVSGHPSTSAAMKVYELYCADRIETARLKDETKAQFELSVSKAESGDTTESQLLISELRNRKIPLVDGPTRRRVLFLETALSTPSVAEHWTGVDFFDKK